MVNPGFSVSIFIGDDTYSKEKAIDDLVSSVLKDEGFRQFDCNIFHGAKDLDTKEVLDCVNTLPLAAQKRVVVVKDFDKLDAANRTRLIDYIYKPVKSAYVILETKDGAVPDGLGGLGGSADIRKFDNLKGGRLSSWITNFTTARSAKFIEPEAVEILTELQGEDLLSLSQELEKLIAFVGERDKIKADDVEEVVGRSLMASAFDITGAVERGKVDSAFKIVSDLILTGKKHYEIIGILGWHFKRLLKAKILAAEGEPNFKIADILRIGRRYRDDFFAQAKRLDVPLIRFRMKILLHADLGVKTARFDPMLVLEFAIIRLCLGR